MNKPDYSASQLRQAANIKERIETLQDELTSVLGTGAPAATGLFPATAGAARKRTMSAAARALISAAQKKRWAAQRATAVAPKTKRFTMSASAKAAISQAAKARWAKIKAAKQN